MSELSVLATDVKALMSRYYSLIGPRHHKDRDCRWYVLVEWKYGEGPEVRVEHRGYLHDWGEMPAASFRDALTKMRDRLREDIADVETWEPDW